MKPATATLLATLALSAAASTAHADVYFQFSYNDATTWAYGEVTATANDNGTFTATSGILRIDTGALVGVYNLIANSNAPSTVYSPRGRFIYDNLLMPDAPAALNKWGLLFASASREINIWGNGANTPYSLWSSTGSGYDYSSNAGQFALVSQAQLVPAPGAATLLACGGLLVTPRRRRAAL